MISEYFVIFGRCVVFGLLMLILLSTVASAETTTVRPKPIDDVLYNPGVGVEMWNRTTWGRTPDPYPKVKVTYYRWYWHQIEPERGTIRWDIIDAAFEDAAKNGDRLGFRLMTVGGRHQGSYQGTTGHMAVPDWWAERVGGFWYGPSDSDRRTFWPDYNGEAFLEEVERIMNAFGDRYRDHPALNHIDTSFFGCWGEQNDACVRPRVDREKHWWTPETYRKAIDIQLAAFPETPFMQLGKTDTEIYDYPMKEKKLGWRVDCFGDYRNFGGSWNHMEHVYPKILDLYGDAWKHGMVSFEICGTVRRWIELDYDFGAIMDTALAWHATTINMKAGDIPEEWMPKMLETIKYMGYRLRVDEAAFPASIESTDPWTLRLKMVNEGVAPPYHVYPIAVKLESTTGQTWVHKTDEVDVRAWLPGDHSVDLSVPAPDLPSGVYKLSVGLLDKHEGMPGIQLANGGREGESFFYGLADIRVVR